LTKLISPYSRFNTLSVTK